MNFISRLKRRVLGRITGNYYAVYSPELHERLESCPTCGKLVVYEDQ